MLRLHFITWIDSVHFEELACCMSRGTLYGFEKCDLRTAQKFKKTWNFPSQIENMLHSWYREAQIDQSTTTIGTISYLYHQHLCQGVYSFCLSVRPLVCSFVCLFVRDMDLWVMKWRSAWPIFHGPVILSYILKTIWCMYIILWEYESVWPDVWPQN